MQSCIGFLLTYEPFHEDAAHIRYLTPDGVNAGFDRKFFKRSDYPFFKDSFLQIHFYRRIDKIYINDITILEKQIFSGQYALLWALLSAYTLTTQHDTQYAPEFFELYKKCYVSLIAPDQDTLVYFNSNQLLFHGVSFTGCADFIELYKLIRAHHSDYDGCLYRATQGHATLQDFSAACDTVLNLLKNSGLFYNLFESSLNYWKLALT